MRSSTLAWPNVHGLLTAYGWGPFATALPQLVRRWATADALHFLAILADLVDAPLCPPLHQKHDAELFKRLWACLLGNLVGEQRSLRYPNVHGAAIVKNCLLLDAYVTNMAPERAYANYLGDRLPAALISVVDGFVLPSPLSIASLLSAFKNTELAVGLAAAIECNPALARAPWITCVLDDLDMQSIASDCLVEADLNAAGRFLFLALQEEPRDDAMFDAVVKVYGVGLLPGVRWIVTKHKDLLPPGFESQVEAYVTAVAPALIKVAPAPRPKRRRRVRQRDASIPAPTKPQQHRLVHDAIELLRIFATAQLPAFVKEWRHLPATLEVTDEVLLPLARLVVSDTPLCRPLLDAAAMRPHVVDKALYKCYYDAKSDSDDDNWDFESPSTYDVATKLIAEAKEVMVARIQATLADLEIQMATHQDEKARVPPPKRQRCG